MVKHCTQYSMHRRTVGWTLYPPLWCM